MFRRFQSQGEQFDATEIIVATENIRDGHLEIFIAYRDRVLMPVPSKN